jgi:uncharacterized protein (TIGR02996 family)
VPVTVKLHDLVLLTGSKHLWPTEFRALADGLESQPDEHTGWGVLADWLKENDEPEFEEAARWVRGRMLRPPILRITKSKMFDRWLFDPIPQAIRDEIDHNKIVDKLVVAAVVILYQGVEKARERMKANLEKLD